MRIMYRAAGMGLFLIFLFTVRAPAITDVMEGADVQAHPETVKDIMYAFYRAEEALRTEDLGGM